MNEIENVTPLDTVQAALLGLDEVNIKADVQRFLKRQNNGQMMRPAVEAEFSKFVREQKMKAIKQGLLSPAQKQFAVRAIETLPQDVLRQLQRRQLELYDAEVFIAGEVVSTGVNEMLNNPPDKATGITNLDDGKVPNAMNLLVTDIMIEFAGHATITAPEDVVYSNILDSDFAGTAFLNGEVEISASGNKVIPTMPVRRFVSVSDQGAADSKGSVKYRLTNPHFILGGSDLNVDLRPATNGSAIAAESFAKVTLMGLATKRAR